MAKVTVKRNIRKEAKQPPPPAEPDSDPSLDESEDDEPAEGEVSGSGEDEDSGLALSSDEEEGGSEGDVSEEAVGQEEPNEDDESEDDFKELKDALADYYNALDEAGNKKGADNTDPPGERTTHGASTTGRTAGTKVANGAKTLQRKHAKQSASKKAKAGANLADGKLIPENGAEEAMQPVQEGDQGGQPDWEPQDRGESSESDEDWRPTAEESDSSEDERLDRNTIGNVPLEWYKDEEHIGYDREGKKLVKKGRKDKLDSFLAHADNPKEWRTIYDEYNDEEITLTSEEIDMIRRIREGRAPHAEVNPYEPYVDWFDYEGGPLNAGPEPKRRFIPSKWEAKKVVKLVRALRKGWIKLDKAPEKPRVYLLWGDDLKTNDKTATGLTYIPPPKPNLPGHDESYNPPPEYIPTQEELNTYELMYEEDRPKFIPRRFNSLREVPSYSEFIKECFERCLDLYLCPRARKQRINIDPESLVPKLPKPKDLQPYPTTLSLEFIGHEGPVKALSIDPTGQWLVSGSSDGSVRIWEIETGRCRKVWKVGGAVRDVAWSPNIDRPIVAVAVGRTVLLLNAGPQPSSLLTSKSESSQLAQWTSSSSVEGALEVSLKFEVHHIAWHHKGDYFATVAPEGGSMSVLVHQLSKQATQNPFKKNHGRVQRVLFHPSRPFFFVATQTHVRCYNLMKQQLAKKLTAGIQGISSMAIHSGGDNLIVGGDDKKVVWFDMDLSTKPYKTLRYHDSAVEGVAFHPSYPLFASASDDGTAHVFHGMVYADLLQNPLLVPLKILRGHSVVESEGVLDCVFHPSQPWLFTAGADKTIKLFCN